MLVNYPPPPPIQIQQYYSWIYISGRFQTLS